MWGFAEDSPQLAQVLLLRWTHTISPIKASHVHPTGFRDSRPPARTRPAAGRSFATQARHGPRRVGCLYTREPPRARRAMHVGLVRGVRQPEHARHAAHLHRPHARAMGGAGAG